MQQLSKNFNRNERTIAVPAVMAILIVYCLRDVFDDFMADGIWRLTAVMIVAVNYKRTHEIVQV